MLLLAGLRARRVSSAAQLRAALAATSPDAFVQVLARNRVTVVCLTRLQEIAPDLLLPEYAAHLAARRDAQRRRSFVLHHLGRRVVAGLAEQGVPAVVLKGTELAQTAHGDAGAREVDDLDVLVARESLGRAREALAGLGFTPAEAQSSSHQGASWIHLEYEHVSGAYPRLELHWRVHWLDERFAGVALRRAHAHGDVCRLRASDELVALLLFYARDGFAGVRLPADLAGVWDSLTDAERAAAPAEVAATVAAHPELERAVGCAAHLANRLVGLPALLQTPRGRRASAAIRMANWDLHGDLDQMKANATIIDLLLSPASSLRVSARRHWAGTGLGLPGSVAHPAKLLGRMAIAAWDVRRDRVPSPSPTRGPSG